MKYLKLSDCSDFSSKRTSDIQLETYISTENMLPNKGGVVKAESIPDCKTTSKYEPHDILLSNIRPYFCKIWYADKEGGCSNDVLVIKAKKGYLPKFLYYVLSDQNFFNYDTVTSKGTKMPRGSKNAIMKYLVPDLDLPTQRRIASILSAYDNLIENNNKRIRLLEQMAENLYKEWFVRFRFPGHEKVEMENGLPKGWKVERLKAIVKRLPFNRTYKEEELEKAGKVVVIDQSTNDVLGYHNNEPSHYADYNNPLIIFGDHSCKFQLMTQNFSLGENVIPFTTCDNSVVNEYWLFYATHKLIKTEEYKRHWGRFSSMKVLIPKIELQNKFADIIVSLEKDKNKLKAENDNLTRQRDLLLPRLMSGKLEVKE